MTARHFDPCRQGNEVQGGGARGGVALTQKYNISNLIGGSRCHFPRNSFSTSLPTLINTVPASKKQNGWQPSRAFFDVFTRKVEIKLLGLTNLPMSWNNFQHNAFHILGRFQVR